MRIALVLLILILASCGGRVDADVGPMVDRDSSFVKEAPQETHEVPTGDVMMRGFFERASHNGRGMVEVVRLDSKDVVRLRSFQVDAGAELHLYLSSDAQASQFTDLGALRNTTGDQDYEIPPGSAPGDFTYALIWSEEYQESWALARLR